VDEVDLRLSRQGESGQVTERIRGVLRAVGGHDDCAQLVPRLPRDECRALTPLGDVSGHAAQEGPGAGQAVRPQDDEIRVDCFRRAQDLRRRIAPGDGCLDADAFASQQLLRCLDAIRRPRAVILEQILDRLPRRVTSIGQRWNVNGGDDVD
jgi:hypothetical protein